MKKGNKEPSPMVQLSVQDITRESKVSPHKHIRGKNYHYMLFDRLYESLWTVPSDLLHNRQSRMGGSFHFLHPGSSQARYRHSSKSNTLGSEEEVVIRSWLHFLLNSPGERRRPRADFGQFDHPSVPGHVQPQSVPGSVVPAGQLWIC